ncbi:PREDICTED: cleavage stimulation factor subunit 3-like isoform X1 [Rhinopithecus bieti]|uniref:Cleavage stimulation factor subunit 3 isoform 2 n=1 Tax=Macaca mulatta TaxID=9544 RepID=H9FQC0_MACMU|nr:PREDICTED: cleavage stimulation factor subunit 3-like isoform X1 [Rhinopithecus bieti]
MSGDGATEQAAEYVPEKVKKAEKKLEENPYDLDAWSILIREAQNQPIDKARKTYERLVAQFPSSGRFWKLYIEAEVTILFYFFLISASDGNCSIHCSDRKQIRNIAN